MDNVSTSGAGDIPAAGGRHRRYVVLSSALLMQTCLGATYAWAVFVQPLRALTGLSQGLVQLPFTLFYFAFPATMIFAGALLPRVGPRRCAVTGGILFGSGWLLASFGQQSFVLTVLGIGLLAGVGVGCAYIVPIAVCIQWFPRHKGLVTGLAVAGFGGGAALIGQLGGALIGAGMSPFDLFRMFGTAFFLVVVTAGLSMEFAPGGSRGHDAKLRTRDLVRRGEFRILYGAMITGLAAGFAVNANLRELAPGQALQAGVAAVSLFALANAAGRVAWGFLFDKIRAAGALSANLLAQSALLCAGAWLLQDATTYFLFAFVAGFNYGGVLVLYASTAARLWGSDRVGQVYGLLFSANIVAAPAPVLAGLSYDLSGSFALSLLIAAGLMIIAAACVAVRAVRLNADMGGRPPAPSPVPRSSTGNVFAPP